MDAADQLDWYRQRDKQGVILVKPALPGGKGGSLVEADNQRKRGGADAHRNSD
jgi:hypothetical protein